MTKFAVPSVHLNGTSQEELERQLREAASAIATAVEKLRQAAPHGRDYYVQEGDALAKAQAEHWSRVERLENVGQELLEVYEAIVFGPDQRHENRCSVGTQPRPNTVDVH